MKFLTGIDGIAVGRFYSLIFIGGLILASGSVVW